MDINYLTHIFSTNEHGVRLFYFERCVLPGNENHDREDVELWFHELSTAEKRNNGLDAIHDSNLSVSNLLNAVNIRTVFELSNSANNSVCTGIIDSEMKKFETSEASILNAMAQTVGMTDINEGDTVFGDGKNGKRNWIHAETSSIKTRDKNQHQLRN